MESDIAWLAPEQEGPSSQLFARVWRTQQDFDRLQLNSRLRSVPDLIDQCHPAAAAHAHQPPPRARRTDARDRSCTVDYDERRAELVGAHGGCPWMVPSKVYKRGVAGLHEEMEDFFVYMSPTPEEQEMRNFVYGSIRNVIKHLWHNAEVFIFGSFETGLYLPTSDIDVVVMGNWENCLELLRDALIRAEICDLSSIKVLDKAAVPIIKLTDRRTEVKVDISFNMKNGLVSARQIKQYMEEYHHMPKLVFALKQFLLQRELNEVFTGGISSYSLILMTVGFLQTNERKLSSHPDCILGLLLIEFFEMYGVKFNYLKTCIKVKDRGFAPRSQVEEQFAQNSTHNSPLCIEDPHNSSNDIGRSSYNMMKVKEAFKYAFSRLQTAVLSADSACDPNRRSILGRVIRVTDRVVEYRRYIRDQFPVPAVPPVVLSQRAASYSPRSSSSPLSSGTSDASDQDGVEASEAAAAARRAAAAVPSGREVSPAGSGTGRPPQQHHHRTGSGRRHHANGHQHINGLPISNGHAHQLLNGHLVQQGNGHPHHHPAARQRRNHQGDAGAVAAGPASRAARHHQGRGSHRPDS